MARGGIVAGIGVLLLLIGAVPASHAATDGDAAGDAQRAASSTDNWNVRVTPYLWFAGFSGTIGIGGRTVTVDAPFSEVFDKLSFGAMVDFEARKGRFVTVVDGFYVSLTDDIVESPDLTVKASSKMLLLNPEAGLRVLEWKKTSFDALAGIRYWHLDNSFEFRSAVLPATPKVSASRDWVDPVVGALVRWNPEGRWSLALQGDAGGFGAASNLTWQVVAAAGYKMSESVALNAGYRYLDVDYRSGGFRFDTAVSGLFLGVSFWF